MCVLYDIVIGLITGAASGWITGVLVTRYYRKKDDKRDAEKFVQDLKRHIVSIYRILREIELTREVEGKVEQVENLRRELLYPPVREKRYFLSDKALSLRSDISSYHHRIFLSKLQVLDEVLPVLPYFSVA